MFNKKIIAISAPQNLQDCFKKWTDQFPIEMGTRDSRPLVMALRHREREGTAPVTIEQLHTQVCTFLDFNLSKIKLRTTTKLDPITEKELHGRKLLGQGGQGSVFEYGADQVVKEIIIGKPVTLTSPQHRDLQPLSWRNSLEHLITEFRYLNQLATHSFCPRPSHIEIRQVDSADGTSYVSIGIVMEKLSGSLEAVLKQLNSHEKRTQLVIETASLLAKESPTDVTGAASGAAAPGIDPQMISAALNLFLDDLQYQLASLVDQMHRLDIAHADLKPGNIGYHWQADGLRLYALDFGHACPLTAIKHRTGSMPYMDSLTLKGFALELILKHADKIFAKFFFETDFETEDIELLTKDVNSAQTRNEAGPKPFDYFALTRILREIATPDEPAPTFDVGNPNKFRLTVLQLATYTSPFDNTTLQFTTAKSNLAKLLEAVNTQPSESALASPKPLAQYDPATHNFLENMQHPDRKVRQAYQFMESDYIQEKRDAHAILQRPEYTPILAAFKAILTS